MHSMQEEEGNGEKEVCDLKERKERKPGAEREKLTHMQTGGCQSDWYNIRIVGLSELVILSPLDFLWPIQQ